MDDIDRRLVNRLQDGLPVARRPFDELAEEVGLGVTELLDRVRCLLDAGVLSRFGPMLNAEQLGGASEAARPYPCTRREGQNVPL